MPHVNIKHFPRTFGDAERRRLAEAITRAIVDSFDTYEGAVSIALEAVPQSDWSDKVVDVELRTRPERVIKMPTYLTD